MSRLARSRARVALGLAAATLATVAIAVPVATAAGTGDDPLQQVRDATRRYRDVDSAIDAGYVQFFGCVHEPLAGAMGVHFVNGTLVGDPTIDATKPEALLYDVEPDGQLSLTGAEYIVFQEAWDALHDQAPTLFGQTFTLVPSPNRFGIPAFYELHVWASKINPSGPFNDWNPKVLCLGTEGHQP